MKKLTKNMKIILISVVSFICVAAIVVGCVFAFRDKNPNNPNNPNNPVTPPAGLTWEQKVDLLGKEINLANSASSTKEYDVLLGVPYEGYVGQGETLTEFSSNYFIVTNDNTGMKSFYHYAINENNNFVITNITETKENGGFAENSTGKFLVKI